MVASPIRSTRLSQIDGLRAIAALAVVLFHYTTRYDQKYSFPAGAPFEFSVGERGVQLFFVISGFVILMSLEAARRPIDFVVSRVTRLYPTYWAAVLMSWCVLGWAQLPGTVRSIGELAANFTMLHGVAGVPAVDGVYWSLEVELIYYLWMLLLACLGALPRIERVLAGWLLLCCGASALTRWAGVATPYSLQHFGLLTWMPWFSLGMLVYLAHKAGHRPALSSMGWVAAALACLAIGLAEGLGPALFAMLVAVTVLAAALRRLPLAGHRSLVLIGGMSYPLYLVHEQVGWILIQRTQALGWPALLSIALAIGVSGMLAYGLHRLVEKPATAFFRRRWAERSAAAGEPVRAASRSLGLTDARWAAACALALVALPATAALAAKLGRSTGAAAGQGVAWSPGVHSPATGWPFGVPAACAGEPPRRPVVLLVFGDEDAVYTAAGRHVPEAGPAARERRCGWAPASSPRADPSASERLWSTLAAELEARQPDVRVTVLSLAVEGQALQRWVRAGAAHERLTRALHAVSGHPLKPAAVLWQHGVTDALAGSEARHYRDGLRQVRSDLHRAGIDAPMVLATPHPCDAPVSGAVGRAVRRLALEHEAGFVSGPDLERVLHRTAGCRLDAPGATQTAALWRASLMELFGRSAQAGPAPLADKPLRG